MKAQATLGGMYYSGTGVEKDAAQAIHWFTLAANQGNPVAQYDLGRIYLFDEQVKNIETGINWIEKSASLGYPKAIELLAHCYYRGKFVPEDKQKAEFLAKRYEEIVKICGNSAGDQ